MIKCQQLFNELIEKIWNPTIECYYVISSIY